MYNQMPVVGRETAVPMIYPGRFFATLPVKGSVRRLRQPKKQRPKTLSRLRETALKGIRDVILVVAVEFA